MFRLGRISLVLISLIFALLSPLPAFAAPEIPVQHFLMSCKATPDIECIKSITAIGPSGFKAISVKPERTVDVIGGLNPIDTREEWAFNGFTFEGTAGNRVVPGFVYRPKGSEDCSPARCYIGLEELQIGIQASWLNATTEEWKKLQVDLSRRGKQELCGTQTSPTVCARNHNFNSPVSFEVVVRMPVVFEPSALLGSVKNLEFKKSKVKEIINGVEYQDLTVKFDPQILQRPLFSNLIPDPLGTSQYADFESDAANFWIVGSRSNQVGGLGRCSTVPFITVLSNSIYQDLPVWNSTNQTVEVGLTAPHFAVNGEIHKGYFEATISKEMGQCLWGIDLSKQAVAKMSISYPTENGSEIQTVSGRFDGTNYILFSANFHYSSPTISFKLVESVTPAPAIVVPIKKTIVCVKGKTSKKVVGVKPQCPKGFKLKV
jgi:hypothetical protein